VSESAPLRAPIFQKDDAELLETIMEIKNLQKALLDNQRLVLIALKINYLRSTRGACAPRKNRFHHKMSKNMRFGRFIRHDTTFRWDCNYNQVGPENAIVPVALAGVSPVSLRRIPP
jgi:hypothetical protein